LAEYLQFIFDEAPADVDGRNDDSPVKATVVT
jgi:hypothetical protein